MTEKTNKTAAPRLKTIVAPTGVFPVEVTVYNPDGSEAGAISFSCIARTQTAWSRERGQQFAKAVARQKAAEAKAKAKTEDEDAAAAEDGTVPEQAKAAEFDPTQLEKMFTERLGGDAEMAMHIAKGWDLDDEFSVANIAALEDAYPGAITDLVNNYSAKIHGARQGN